MDSNARKYSLTNSNKSGLNAINNKSKEACYKNQCKARKSKSSREANDMYDEKPLAGNMAIHVNSVNTNFPTTLVQPSNQYLNTLVVNCPNTFQQNYGNYVLYPVPNFVSVAPLSTPYAYQYPTLYMHNVAADKSFLLPQSPFNSYNNFKSFQAPYYSYEKVKSYNPYPKCLLETECESSNNYEPSKIKISESSTSEKKLTEFYLTLSQFYSCKDPVSYINSLKGSRHVQKLLQKNEAEAFTLYEYLEKFKNEIIFNVYGNYVMKRIFSLLKASQRKIVWKRLEKDLKSYGQHVHASHSIIMLISKSDNDIEVNEIEDMLIPIFDDLINSEQAIGILSELISKLNFKGINVKIVNKVYQSISEILHNKAAVVLCKKLITCLGEEGNNQLYLDNLIKAIIPRFLSMKYTEELNSLLIQILEEWSIEKCQELTRIIDSNFTCLAKASCSSPVIIQYLTKLDLNVS